MDTDEDAINFEDEDSADSDQTGTATNAETQTEASTSSRPRIVTSAGPLPRARSRTDGTARIWPSTSARQSTRSRARAGAEASIEVGVRQRNALAEFEELFRMVVPRTYPRAYNDSVDSNEIDLSSDNDLVETSSVSSVNDDTSEASEESEVRSTEIRFDTNLPAEHSYMGNNMNRVSGVEYLEAGRVHRIMLFLHQHIVYPGEVVPFMIPGFIIDEDIDTNNGLLFGLAFAHVCCSRTQAMYGVTCQIYEKGTDERGNTLIKSRALQRFITTNDTKREHLEYITSGLQLKTFGHVKILPEIYLPDFLSTINLGSMNRFRDIPRLEHYLRDFQATTTIWPKYVYNQYNMNTVLEKVLKSLEAHKVETIPNDPVRLSFWLGRNSHFSEEQLKSIFITDSVNLRMRIIADSFNAGGVFVCRFCRNNIAYCRDLFAMSKHGVQSQYCNSAGHIHKTYTVYKVFHNSIILSGEPSSEFSWFPGYEWHIIICKMCNRHIGWQFRANEPNLTPVLFYGITGTSVRIDKESKRRSLRDQLFNNLVRLVDL